MACLLRQVFIGGRREVTDAPLHRRVEVVRYHYSLARLYTDMDAHLRRSARHGKRVTYLCKKNVSAVDFPVSVPAPRPSESNNAPWILLYLVNPCTSTLRDFACTNNALALSEPLLGALNFVGKSRHTSTSA